MKRPGVAAGYVLVGLAMVAGWQLESTWAVVLTATIVALLTVVLYADFLRLGAKAPGGYELEVERARALEGALAEADELSRPPALVDDISPEDSKGTVDEGTVDEGTVDEGTVDEGTVDEGTVDQGPRFVLPADFLRGVREKAMAREKERRRALERLVEEAAEWGWSSGVKGSPRPAPKVNWSEEGQPRLVMTDEAADARMRALRQLLSEATGGLWRDSDNP
jgi:hypothetical protein